MGARGEVIQTPAPWDDLPVAAAWLLGYVQTGVPGYRDFVANATAYQVTSDHHRFDDFLTAMNFGPFGDTADTVTDWVASGKGKFDDGGASAAITETPDRLGWLIGAGVEAGSTVQAFARFIPPAGIPLIGYTWDRVEKDADRRKISDTYQRNQGYVWGAANLFTCQLHMHRYALEALMTGWCMRGKVTLGGRAKLDDPWSLADPKGAITGYVVGVEQPEWSGQRQQNAVVTMTIATE